MSKSTFFKLLLISIFSSTLFSCGGVRKGAVKAADDGWSFIKGIFKSQDDNPPLYKQDVKTTEEYIWEKVDEHWSDAPDVMETVSDELKRLNEEEDNIEP